MTRRYWGLRPWKRHSLILMVAGFVYALIGLGYVLTEPTPAREQALVLLLQFAPLKLWGVVFIFCGILSMVSSRWPPFAETWGYMVLTGISAGWSAAYLLGLLFFDSPNASGGQALLWGCLAFMWWAISGLLNPDKTAVTYNGGD